MSGHRGEVSRRTAVKLGIGAVAAAGAAALGVHYTSERAIAASGLTAEDVSIESAEGRVQALTLAPTATVQWENYPAVKTVNVRFRADGPQSNGTVVDWTGKQLDSAASSGTVSLDIGTAHMLGKNDGPLDASSFHATQEGETVEKQVAVMMDVALVDGNDNTVEKLTPGAKVTYTVRVTNRKSELVVSGKLNTGGKCIETNDFPEALWSDVECRLRDVASSN